MRVAQILSRAAKALDGVGEGVACAGTALESKTYTVGGKAFLFVDSKNARLKLALSADEARALTAAPGSAVKVGAGGWTTIRLAEGVVPEDPVLRRWVGESHALFRGKPAKAARGAGATGAKPGKGPRTRRKT